MISEPFPWFRSMTPVICFERSLWNPLSQPVYWLDPFNTCPSSAQNSCAATGRLGVVDTGGNSEPSRRCNRWRPEYFLRIMRASLASALTADATWCTAPTAEIVICVRQKTHVYRGRSGVLRPQQEVWRAVAGGISGLAGGCCMPRLKKIRKCSCSAVAGPACSWASSCWNGF